MANPRMADKGPSGFHETLEQEYVACGKNCSTCPNHGPYWYAYWTDADGRTRKRYVGKYRTEAERREARQATANKRARADQDKRRRAEERRAEERRRAEEQRREQQQREEQREEERRRDEQHRRREERRYGGAGDLQDTADAELLGVSVNVTRGDLKRAYRAAALAAHPDRGGSHKRMVEVNVAYDRMMRRRGWT